MNDSKVDDTFENKYKIPKEGNGCDRSGLRPEFFIFFTKSRRVGA
jgi:hypothetical protein